LLQAPLGGAGNRFGVECDADFPTVRRQEVKPSKNAILRFFVSFRCSVGRKGVVSSQG
jgi:hypothetical protein